MKSESGNSEIGRPHIFGTIASASFTGSETFIPNALGLKAALMLSEKHKIDLQILIK